MTFEEGYVTMDDGVRIFARTQGQGRQTVIVPNGFYLLDDFGYLAEGRTLVVYDPRNRGRSDTVEDPERLKNGIHHDVDDLDTIRRHVGASRISLLGHSYVGMAMLLYTMKFPDQVNRVVQMGPLGPEPTKQYPAPLSNNDPTLLEAIMKITELQKERASLDPVA